MVNANSALPRLPKEPHDRHLVTPSRWALGLGKIERMTAALAVEYRCHYSNGAERVSEMAKRKEVEERRGKCEVLNAYLANPNLPHAVATHRKEFE